MADEGFERKLTAILSADVEGYSRLMDDDEAATVRTLTAYARLTDNTRREAYYKAMAIIESGEINGHYRLDYQLP